MNRGKAKRIVREIIAALAQLIGASVRVAALVPVINPGMYRVQTGRTEPDFLFMAILGTLGQALIVAGRICQRRFKAEPPSTEKNDPLTGEKVPSHEIMSDGSSICGWPSKYDLVICAIFVVIINAKAYNLIDIVT